MRASTPKTRAEQEAYLIEMQDGSAQVAAEHRVLAERKREHCLKCARHWDAVAEEWGRRLETLRRQAETQAKGVAYLSAEYLLGRQLGNALLATGLTEVVEEGHGVLGGDVARGAGRERRATDAADAGVEPPDHGPEPRAAHHG